MRASYNVILERWKLGTLGLLIPTGFPPVPGRIVRQSTFVADYGPLDPRPFWVTTDWSLFAPVWNPNANPGWTSSFVGSESLRVVGTPGPFLQVVYKWTATPDDGPPYFRYDVIVSPFHP